MKREKRPNGNWGVCVWVGVCVKLQGENSGQGEGALFHFAETIDKFMLNFLTVFIAEKIMYFV